MGNFVKHEECESCGSSDGKAVYNDGSSYCFVCEKTVPSEEFKKNNPTKTKITKRQGVPSDMKDNEVQISSKELKPIIDKETAQEVKNNTSTKGSLYRGIKDEVLQYFGVRIRYKEDSEGNAAEEVQAMYYPVTYEGKLSGYKIRKHPKTFSSIGRTGVECDLFGQFRFNQGGKSLLIVGGELDQLSAYQMIREYQVSKGNGHYEPPAVVSPTIGESGCTKQIQKNYSFFDKFEKIIVAFDNDDAGKKATEKIMPALPKNKVFVMQMRFKDPNEYLIQGESQKFIRDYYEAKKYVPAGIVGSNQISSAMREELAVEKIPLPPFMHKLQKMMAGGIPLGRILTLLSASGTGKSTIIDEMVYYWLFNSPHLVGIVTLESTVGQYGVKLLSRHVSKKIELLDREDALEFVEQEKVKEKEFELFNKAESEPRFYLVDDRDGGVDNIKQSIENLIISCNCKVIVLDPIQDCIGTLPQEEQESFMGWQKGMVKSHHVTFINVSHTRKTSGGQKAGSVGGDLNEEDAHGHSSIYKSAACNLVFGRNKEAECSIERNTTTMKATKIRWSGVTGIAGKYFYDNQTHTLHDLDDYLKNNPDAVSDF